MSNSAPSGLTRKTIQTSRVSTMRGDPRIVAVAVDEPVEDVERHLDAHVLVGVVAAVEHDLGLGLVDADVVGDLDRPEVAALVALADREAGHDRRDGRRPRRRPRRSARCSCGSRFVPAGNSVAVVDRRPSAGSAGRRGAARRARVRRPAALSHDDQHAPRGPAATRPVGPATRRQTSRSSPRRPVRFGDDRARRRPGRDRRLGCGPTRRPP